MRSNSKIKNSIFLLGNGGKCRIIYIEDRIEKGGMIMSRITDYSFLFQSMFGKSSANLVNNIQLSQINSTSVQAQLKAAGINTNSKQYKAALSEMVKNGNGAMFTNVQAIKNLMSQYDKNGDWVDPNTGLTGLAVTDENRNSYKHIISIPESSRDEMFELAKKEFLRDNGTLNGDTTKRESVYTNLYRKMKKDDRLSAGWTMEQYEHQYRQAFAAAVKAANPIWKAGESIPSGALDGITRESVENGGKSVDIKI